MELTHVPKTVLNIKKWLRVTNENCTHNSLSKMFKKPGSEFQMVLAYVLKTVLNIEKNCSE